MVVSTGISGVDLRLTPGSSRTYAAWGEPHADLSDAGPMESQTRNCGSGVEQAILQDAR